MSRIRTILTPEYAVENAKGLVPITKLAEAVGRTDKMVYKWSNSDEDAQIPFWAAMKIDLLCYKEKGVAPFLRLLEQQISLEQRKQTVSINLHESVLQSQSALGQLSGAVADATSANSDMGKKISPREASELMTATEKMREQIDLIEASIKQAST